MNSKEVKSLWEAYASVYAPQEVEEGIRDLDPEKGTKERKAKLEKKRGMKMDDHPQYKKEDVESEGYEPMTPERKMRVDKAKKGAYDKDMMAQSKGDTKEADKQFKRRMAMDFKTKMKKEEVDTFDLVFEILDEEIENALEVMSQLTPDEVQEIAEGDLAAKARAKAVEMGRKRRSTKEYKAGGARGTGKNERAAYNLANAQQSTNADLGSQKRTDKASGMRGHQNKSVKKTGSYDYGAVLDKKDPKKNPKHTDNK